MSNQYPIFDSPIKSQPKNYPTFSQINPTESIDVRIDAQGSKIQDQPVPKKMGSYLNDSTNPMYDVNYDSGNAKTQHSVNNQRNMQIYPNNVPDYQNNNNVGDQQYDAHNSKIYNKPIANDEYNVLSMAYDSKKNNGCTNYNYPSPYPQAQVQQRIQPKMAPQQLAMNQNMPPYSEPYDFVPPHEPHMFPHFPHHPHFPYHPHFPHHPHFPVYPPEDYPYEDYYGYC